MGKGNVTECIHCGHMKDVADRLCPACGKEVDQRSQELDDTGSPESKLVPSPSSSSASQIYRGLSIALWVCAATFLLLGGLGDARFIIAVLLALLLHVISVRKKNGSMHPGQQSDNTGSTESQIVPLPTSPSANAIEEGSQELDDTGSPESKLVPSPSSSSASQICGGLSIALWVGAAGFLFLDGLGGIADARFIIPGLIALLLHLISVRKKNGSMHPEQQSDNTGSTESGLVPSTLTPSAPELYRELSIVLWLCAAGILIFGGLEAIGDARFIIAVLLALFLKVVIVRKRKEKIHLQEQSDDVE